MPNTPTVALSIPQTPDNTSAVGERAFSNLAQALWSGWPTRVAVCFLALLVLSAIFAPLLSPHDPRAQADIVAFQLRPPSAAHPLGTDAFSRDVWSRLVFGARLSLELGILGALLTAVVGLVYGATAGYVGGWIDGAMMRLVDAFLSVPRVLLVLCIAALWREASVLSLVLTLGLSSWFGVARLARAEALVVRSQDFVTAARALGASPIAIVWRHILPHTMGPVIVAATVSVAQIIVLEAGLAFIGFGIPEPTPSWGNIIASGRETLQVSWWLTLFPGLALIGTSLSVTIVADRLRQRDTFTRHD